MKKGFKKKRVSKNIAIVLLALMPVVVILSFIDKVKQPILGLFGYALYGYIFACVMIAFNILYWRKSVKLRQAILLFFFFLFSLSLLHVFSIGREGYNSLELKFYSSPITFGGFLFSLIIQPLAKLQYNQSIAILLVLSGFTLLILAFPLLKWLDMRFAKKRDSIKMQVSGTEEVISDKEGKESRENEDLSPVEFLEKEEKVLTARELLFGDFPPRENMGNFGGLIDTIDERSRNSAKLLFDENDEQNLKEGHQDGFKFLDKEWPSEERIYDKWQGNDILSPHTPSSDRLDPGIIQSASHSETQSKTLFEAPTYADKETDFECKPSWMHPPEEKTNEPSVIPMLDQIAKPHKNISQNTDSDLPVSGERISEEPKEGADYSQDAFTSDIGQSMLWGSNDIKKEAGERISESNSDRELDYNASLQRQEASPSSDRGVDYGAYSPKQEASPSSDRGVDYGAYSPKQEASPSSDRGVNYGAYSPKQEASPSNDRGVDYGAYSPRQEDLLSNDRGFGYDASSPKQEDLLSNDRGFDYSGSSQRQEGNFSNERGLDYSVSSQREEDPPTRETGSNASRFRENIAENRSAAYGDSTGTKPVKKEEPYIEQITFDTLNIGENTTTPQVGERVVSRKESFTPTQTSIFDKEDDIPIKTKVKKPYVPPQIDFLKTYPGNDITFPEDYYELKQKIETTLAEFDVPAEVFGAMRGPAFTLYELKLGPGYQISKIKSLKENLKMRLEVSQLRILAPIEGRDAFGLEVPNKKRDIVGLKTLVEDPKFAKGNEGIKLCLGKTLQGENFYADLAEMPHLLVAGATGTGKSVFLNSAITSILYRYSPDEVRLILIDPKRVELSVYKGLPHLLISETVKENVQAVNTLKWLTEEMDRRYKLFEDVGCPNIDKYNEFRTEGPPMYRIVLVIDEMSDLMIKGKGEVESYVVRISQLARACGIHLIIATQRPVVRVITGIIKSNIIARIAFQVKSNTDSRVVLDDSGAEDLLGKGDMLYSSSTGTIRLQGSLIEIEEIKKICDYIRANNESDFNEDLYNALNVRAETSDTQPSSTESKDDRSNEEFESLLAKVLLYFIQMGKASISSAQSAFGIGFMRGRRIVDALESRGYIGASTPGTQGREVLMTEEEYYLEFEDQIPKNE